MSTKRTKTQLKAVRFEGDDKFLFGLNELSLQYGFTVSSEGYKVKAVKVDGNVLKVQSHVDNAVIYYPKDNCFFRGFSLAMQYYGKENEITVDLLFNDVGTMQNCSETVLTVEGLKEFVRYSAVMGYTYVGIYTEATYTVENEQYFGYKSGAYSVEELSEITEYCEKFFVEAVPYIQTLSHMNQLFRWSAFGEVVDTDNILLVDYDRTYALIENMLSSLRKVYKTDKINLGMDEGYKIGTGRYRWFINEEYTDTVTLFINHLKKVIAIAEKYGFTKPEIWFDNIFGMMFKGYIYPPEWLFKDFSEKIKNEFPKIKLNLWYYGISTQEEMSRVINNVRQLSDELSFSTIVHGYSSFAPLNAFAEKADVFAKDTCLNNGISDILVTNWGFLPPVMLMAGYFRFIESFAKSTGYDFYERAKYLFGYGYDELKSLDIPNEVEFEKKPDNVYEYNPPYYILADDPLLGIMEKNIPTDAEKYYEDCAIRLSKVSTASDTFSAIFEYEKALCKALSKKAPLSAMLKKYYDDKDKNGLKASVKKIDKAIKEIKKFHIAFRKLWLKFYKSYGIELFDMRFGGIVARLNVIKQTLKEYVAGKIDKIEELEEARLPYAKGTENKITCNANWDKIAVGRNMRV